MHFKGMLAFHLPVPVEYHWPTVLASLLGAVLASAVALYVASRQKMGPVAALAGSIFMGTGIAGMHYIGMAAMRLPAVTRFSALLVACSILLAILFSLIALLMTFDLREETRWSVPRRLGSATVMGVAVSAMHYTGMAAASFFPASSPDLSHAVTISSLGNNGIVIVTLIVIVAAMTTSSMDRRRNEEHLRLVIDTAPAMLHSARPDGYVDFLNKRWLEYVGVSLEEISGWRWSHVIHPEDVEGVVGKWRSSVATGKPFEAEARLRRADGEYRLMLLRKVPLRDESGSIVKWYGSATDIEDRKRAEDAVRRSEEHLRLVIDTTPAMIHSARPDGYLDFFNKRWLEYLGVSLDELLGWHWTHVIHPDDLAQLVDKWQTSLATGRPFEAEARLRRADGEYRLTLHRKVPLRDETGNIVKWYGSVIDIEDRKRAEEELKGSEERHRVIVEAARDAVRQAQEDLSRVSRVVAMGELAAAIAHEVNQPLGAVVTNASASLRWLAGQPPNLEEAREAIERTVREANRASDVIRRIRALLQKGPPQMERLDVNAVIREVLTLAGNELLRGGVAVRTELASDIPNVLGDRVQLQQVLLNLILNGVDAMSTITDRPRELLLKSSRHPNGVLIQVHDSGEGVDPRQADHIFEPFFTTKAQGIGMGLSVGRSIVEAHGGRLWFTPGSPHGVVFQFIVPKADTSDERAA